MFEYNMDESILIKFKIFIIMDDICLIRSLTNIESVCAFSGLNSSPETVET